MDRNRRSSVDERPSSGSVLKSSSTNSLGFIFDDMSGDFVSAGKVDIPSEMVRARFLVLYVS